MMANAIGPQNTVGAIGIRPSTVEIAVRIIGRRRDVADAITASCTPLPSARSVSICTTRITAFFAIMPISARMPRIATKPSGRLNTSSATTTPISPSGSRRDHHREPAEAHEHAASWSASISTIISGTTANTDALDIALSSYRPPVATW